MDSRAPGVVVIGAASAGNVDGVHVKPEYGASGTKRIQAVVGFVLFAILPALFKALFHLKEGWLYFCTLDSSNRILASSVAIEQTERMTDSLESYRVGNCVAITLDVSCDA